MGRILGLTKTRLNRNQLLGVVNGGKKIELVAKGLGQCEKIYYALDVFGKKITFLNSNQICSVKDLDIHAALGLFGDKITFVIGNKIRSVNNFDVTATYS